jgi:phenylacetate-CoA ligase
VQSESLVVEILDPQGRACAPGTVGRVVVSTLHNFAMPLLRYDIGDYAEAGAPCPCGRGLPTLARILGRQRNMLVLPNGERRWPLSGFRKYREIAPIRQYQIVQHAPAELEARFVAERALSAGEEQRLGAAIREAMGYPFEIAFTRLESFPPGKFEDFISLIDCASLRSTRPAILRRIDHAYSV